MSVHVCVSSEVNQQPNLPCPRCQIIKYSMECFQEAHKALLNHLHTHLGILTLGFLEGELLVLQVAAGSSVLSLPDSCSTSGEQHSAKTMLSSSYFGKYLFEKLGEESWTNYTDLLGEEKEKKKRKT